MPLFLVSGIDFRHVGADINFHFAALFGFRSYAHPAAEFCGALAHTFKPVSLFEVLARTASVV